MAAITYMFCFGLVIRELFSKGEMNERILLGSLFCMSICSIAWAIENYISQHRNKKE